MNGFYLQHGKCSLGLCCRTRGKVVSKETVRKRNGFMRRLRWQRVSVGRARDCVRCNLAKAMFQLEGK